MISYDKARDLIVFRQFNIEGYVNQPILNKEKSTENELVFESEIIENFMPGGKAKWVIKKISKNEIETKFFVSFPGEKISCFGTNNLTKQKWVVADNYFIPRDLKEDKTGNIRIKVQNKLAKFAQN